MDTTLKYLITSAGGVVFGVVAGAIWDGVDKRKTPTTKTSTALDYSPIIKSDSELVHAIEQFKRLKSIKIEDHKSLVNTINSLGKQWMSVEATPPANVASDAAFTAAKLYEEVHTSLDFMFENAGIPMSDGKPLSYEMKKLYSQILRSCDNWKHNTLIAAQSKKRYL